MWNRISKTKEKEGQKLVIFEQPTCDEIGQPIESRENDQASHKSNAAVEQMQNSSPQSPTAKPQWTSKRGAGLRHHKMVVRSVVVSLIVLSIGMGFSIYQGGVVSKEIRRGFDLLADGKWQHGYDVLVAFAPERVGRQFERDENSSRVANALYPSHDRLTTIGESLVKEHRLQEAETAYRGAIAFEFDDFSTKLSDGHYAVNRPVTAVTRLAELLREQNRVEELKKLLLLSKAMHCVEYDLTQLARSIKFEINTAMTEESEKQSKYINALKYARQTYTNLGFADKNTEYYRNQKRRLLIMIDEQIKDFPDFAPGWLVRAEVNLIDDPISSIKDLDHLLRLYPGLPYALEMRARAQIELKQFEEALKDYDSALDTVRGSESLLLDKTKLLERLHRIDAAIATIDEALRTNAASVKLHLHKADLLASIGRQQEALNELRFAVLILDVRRQVGKIVYSENDTTYIDIARKMFDLAKPNEALATLDKSRFKKDPRAIELRTRIEQTQESTSKESGRSN